MTNASGMARPIITNVRFRKAMRNRLFIKTVAFSRTMEIPLVGAECESAEFGRIVVVKRFFDRRSVVL